MARMDSVVNTTPDSPSPYAIMPIAGYISAASSLDMGKLVVARGQIGHVIFLKQHFHEAVAGLSKPFKSNVVRSNPTESQ
jgi:hypothetical protein